MPDDIAMEDADQPTIMDGRILDGRMPEDSMIEGSTTDDLRRKMDNCLSGTPQH